MKYEIRELKVTEILDQAIKLIQDNYKLLFGITAVLLIPVCLVQQLLAVYMQENLAVNPTPAPGPGTLVPIMILALVNSLLAFVVIPVTNAALVHAVARKYLHQPTGIGQALGFALQRIVPLAWTWFVLILAIMGGFILCILPGILASLWFALATQVVVLEGVSGFAALKRSKELMKDHIGKLFLLGIVVFAINAAATMGAAFTPQPHLRAVVASLVQGLQTVFGTATAVLFYFSARCKHENFDLTLLANSVAETESSTAVVPGLE